MAGNLVKSPRKLFGDIQVFDIQDTLRQRAEASETEMWITRRTDYATRAVLALTLVTDGRPRKIHELADATRTPVTVLEQVLPQLRSAGIVRSERGPSGGYRLNHPPEEITLDKVVRLFEGPLAPIPCATRHEPEPCPMDAGCSLRDVWADVRDATIRILEQTTFADLATRSSGAWTEIAAPTLARSNA